MDARGIRAAIGYRDTDEDVLLGDLRVFGEHVEIPIVGKRIGITQLKLAVLGSPATIFLAELCVWELALRIFVESAQVGGRRCGVQIPVCFLHVFAVRALAVCQAKKALFQ